MSKKTFQIECQYCYGTGLYSGFAEGPGGAVICKGCQGSGCEVFVVQNPFIKRKRKRISNGQKLTKVFVEGPVWDSHDERTERKWITPKEFYSRGEYKK